MNYTSAKHVCMLPREPDSTDEQPTAGITRLLICKFREMMLPCSWHHGTLLYIRSYKSLRTERNRQICLGLWLMWHPYSALKFFWDCFVMAVTFVVFAYMPVHVFFRCPNPYDPFILFTDLVTFVDLIICFFTGYVDEDQKMIVLEPKLVAKRYLRSTFVINLIGSLPLQLIEPFENCRYPSHTAMFVFKLFRISRLREQWKSLLEQLELTYISKVTLTIAIRGLLFFHWMTYIHYQVPALYNNFYEFNNGATWLDKSKVLNIEPNSIFQMYTTNMLLACALCIGAGYYNPVDKHLIPQMLLTTVLSLTGLLFLTYSFTTLLRLMIYRHFESYLFNGRCKELQEFMSQKQLPRGLQRKIQLFINYKFSGHYFNEKYILNTVNEQIKHEINMYSCKQLVMNVPLFQDLPVALINSIIFCMRQILYMPGETVVRHGQSSCSLYLISSGTVVVMDSGNREIAHLRDGAFFGETTLLHPGILHTTTIIAIEITEMYNLNSKDFQACLQPYPQLKRRLEDVSLKRRATHFKPINSYIN